VGGWVLRPHINDHSVLSDFFEDGLGGWHEGLVRHDSFILREKKPLSCSSEAKNGLSQKETY
jgi:hypothetical protein